MNRRAGWLLAVVFGGALAAGGLSAHARGLRSTWQIRPAEAVGRSRRFQQAVLRESSGLVASRRQPGVLWTFNDSGNPPWIFATDTLGRDLGAFAVTGAVNQDWEAIAIGRCGQGDCLYIADTGDNDAVRSSVQLYRVREPQAGTSSRVGATARAEMLDLRYPDGPRDLEAAFVDPSGDVVLVSKGRQGRVDAFRVPAGAWGHGRARRQAVAQPEGQLPIDARRALVTDASISPAGDEVAIRTYGEIYFFRFGAQRRLRPLWDACNVAGIELQGEGIAWLGQGRFALASEGGLGAPGTITVVRCSTR